VWLKPETTWLILAAAAASGCGSSVDTDRSDPNTGANTSLGGSGGVGGAGGAGATGGAGGGKNLCPDPSGTRVRFDAELQPLDIDEATQWLAYPFPADHRRTATGNIDLSDFPNPGGIELLTDYIEHGSAVLDGFGLNSPAYFSFTSPIDTSGLSVKMEDFVDAVAPMFLIDITPSSPGYGTRVPLRWSHQVAGGKYIPAATLAIAPAWGFPLRERTTYAAVITDAIADEGGLPIQPPPVLSELLAVELPVDCQPVRPSNFDDLFTQFEPLRVVLAAEGTAPTSIAAATIFTTQSVTSELGAVRDHIYQTLPAPPLDDTWLELGGPGTYHQQHSFQWTSAGDSVDYYELSGTFPSPNYQQGTPPYAAIADGGGFSLSGGVPVVANTEDLRFYLTIPAAPPLDGPCYPIVEFAHGTTGSAAGFVSASGGRFAARGLAAIGIDQPLHGPRWAGSSSDSDLELYSYNFFNPSSGRTLLRQSAADTFSLTRFILESLSVPANRSPTGAPICFDTSRIAFFGHSQGGLSGALAAAYEDNVDTWVLSGTSGGQAITMIERKDPADILLAMGFLLAPSPMEELTEDHPTFALVQTIAEVVDGLNYARYWADATDLSQPVNLLLTSGTLDSASPHRGAAALAVAGRVPILAPVVVPIPAYDVAGLTPLSSPASSTLNGATVGFMQWGDDGLDASHHVIFKRPEAVNASMRLLQSASFENAPVLERDPMSTAQ